MLPRLGAGPALLSVAGTHATRAHFMLPGQGAGPLSRVLLPVRGTRLSFSTVCVLFQILNLYYLSGKL